MLLNNFNRDMFEPFPSHRGLLGQYSGRVLEDSNRSYRRFLQRVWSDGRNCSHNASQKFQRVRHFSKRRQFVTVCSQNVCSQFLCPLTPPPPNQQNDGFPLEFLLKGPQTELRTLSQNCEQTLQKLRTNRIMNKPAFLIF